MEEKLRLSAQSVYFNRSILILKQLISLLKSRWVSIGQ